MASEWALVASIVRCEVRVSLILATPTSPRKGERDGEWQAACGVAWPLTA